MVDVFPCIQSKEGWNEEDRRRIGLKINIQPRVTRSKRIMEITHMHVSRVPKKPTQAHVS